MNQLNSSNQQTSNTFSIKNQSQSNSEASLNGCMKEVQNLSLIQQQTSNPHQFQKPINSLQSVAIESKSKRQQQQQQQLSSLFSANKDAQKKLKELQQELIQLEQQGQKLDTQIHIAQEEYELELLHGRVSNLETLQKDSNEQGLVTSFQSKPNHKSVQEQNEMDMNTWIESVQKYNGLPQESIDMLISMEYEQGPESDICLSCYKEMQHGQMCKYLPCCHLFHSNCADQHLKISKVCPACMEQVVVM